MKTRNEKSFESFENNVVLNASTVKGGHKKKMMEKARYVEALRREEM